MKKQLITLILCYLGCAGFSQTMPYQSNAKQAKTEISDVIDHWHQAAAEANFKNYFHLMTKDAVFIGTDATENWQIEEFIAYAKHGISLQYKEIFIWPIQRELPGLTNYLIPTWAFVEVLV